jgi:hypothetical protein
MELLSAPLDDSLFIATGAQLWLYDNFFCLRALSPASPACGAPFVALDFVHGAPGTLLAATALNIFALAAPDPASPSCGAPLLPASPSRAITAVRGTPTSGVFFTEGGGVWVTPPLASTRPMVPRLLLGNGVGGDLITGARAGLALWGERYLYYGAAGTSGWPGDNALSSFRGVLRAGLDGAAPAVFFHYASNSDVLHWAPGRLASAGGNVAWSELRNVPDKPPPVFAVQRTLLGGNASVTVVTSYLCEVPGSASGGEVSVAGDDGGVGGGGVLWTACGRAVAAWLAGPKREPPLVELNFANAPPGSAAAAAPPVTALAFAPGSAYCGHRFSYAQPADGALLCAPRPRLMPRAECLLADPVAAVRLLPLWATALLVVVALLVAAGCALGAWRAGRSCCRAACGCCAAGAVCCARRGNAPPNERIEMATLVAVERGAGGEDVSRREKAWEEVSDVGENAAVVDIAPRPALPPLRLLSNRGKGRKLSGSGSRIL